jgi:hypothetical protein
VFYQSLETCILNIESNSKCHSYVPKNLMELLKSPLDLNPVIYHKFNDDFKSHISFGGTQERYGGAM